MTSPRDYPNIDEFLGSSGPRADEIEKNLSILSRQEFEDLNDAFTCINFDRDPVGDWRNDMFNGKVTGAFAEIVLVWHTRRKLGHESVELNPEYTGTGRDFDLRVELHSKQYWIEVTSPQFAEQVRGRGGGWIPKTRTTNSIDRKLREEFDTAREDLDDDKILILGIYLEGGLIQKIIIGDWLSQGHYHPGQFCDAFIEFSHYSGTTEIDTRPFTAAGEHVTELKDELSF